MFEIVTLHYAHPPVADHPESVETQHDTLPFVVPQSSTGYAIRVTDDGYGWLPIHTTNKAILERNSVLSDGRVPYLYSDGAVEETIELVLVGASLTDYSKQVSRLWLFRDRARAYYEEEVNPYPVYLEVRMEGERYSRYSLITNIEITVEHDPPSRSTSPSGIITLQVTRDVHWYGVPPLWNPISWVKLKDDTFPKTADLSLYSDSTHLFNETITNHYISATTRNYVDVPADDIPGDAPCDVMLLVETDSAMDEIIVARVAKPSLNDEDGTPRHRFYNFAAYRGYDFVGTPGLIGTTSTGYGLGASEYVYRFDGDRTLVWGVEDALIDKLDVNLLAGRFMVFARGRMGTTNTDVSVTLELHQQGYYTVAVFEDIAIPNGGDTGIVQMDYLGEMVIPIVGKGLSHYDGRGLYVVPDDPVNYVEAFSIHFKVTGATGTDYYDLIDLVLIPIDESVIRITQGDPGAAPGANRRFVLDGTGYINRDKTTPLMEGAVIAASGAEAGEYTQGDISLTGQRLTLKPGVVNSLFFFGSSQYSGGGSNIHAQADFEVYVNLVPKWYGLSEGVS